MPRCRDSAAESINSPADPAIRPAPRSPRARDDRALAVAPGRTTPRRGSRSNGFGRRVSHRESAVEARFSRFGIQSYARPLVAGSRAEGPAENAGSSDSQRLERRRSSERDRAALRNPTRARRSASEGSDQPPEKVGADRKDLRPMAALEREVRSFEGQDLLAETASAHRRGICGDEGSPGRRHRAAPVAEGLQRPHSGRGRQSSSFVT